MSEGVLEVLDRAVEAAEDADDVLRETVRILAAEPGVAWVGIALLDEGALVPGPAAGEPDEARRVRTPIVWQGAAVGELQVDGDVERELLETVAAMIATHVLIGWDTGGEAWEP